MAVIGCGGVGLSSVVVALAAGAQVVVSDISMEALAQAEKLGAVTVPSGPEAVAAVREVTGGGAHLAIDAVGSRATAEASIASLRPRGRHVQVGLLLDAEAAPAVPLGRVIAEELELLGSHGMSIGEYAAMLADIVAGRLRPDAAIGRTIPFEALPQALTSLDCPGPTAGMTVAVLSPSAAAS